MVGEDCKGFFSKAAPRTIIPVTPLPNHLRAQPHHHESAQTAKTRIHTALVPDDHEKAATELPRRAPRPTPEQRKAARPGNLGKSSKGGSGSWCDTWDPACIVGHDADPLFLTALQLVLLMLAASGLGISYPAPSYRRGLRTFRKNQHCRPLLQA